jgi:NADPH2:quinone reductase
MAQAVEVRETGGTNVLTVIDLDVPDPAKGEVTIEQKAIGLNFIDVYFRTGLYNAPALPFTPGMEGAGVVTALGKGVTHLSVGDRVAYAGPMGAYAASRNIAADRLVKLPGAISFETAAGMMLKGMTAQYLLRQTYCVKEGDTVLIHAAAGGVGLIACQWANALGATVIGTAGSEEKMELARENGAHHMINYREEDFVSRIAEITEGAKCNVVYDSVGKDTFPGSLDCLKMRGTWASFGQSSGPLPPVDLALLAQNGSLFATRPTLFNYIASQAELEACADDLFDVFSSGKVSIPVNATYALSDVRTAHEDLEGRRTTGSTVLVP